MRIRRMVRVGMLGALGAAALLAAGATPALAQGPWFHLSSVGRPTNLSASSSSLEEQEVVVSAEGGAFILSEPIATGHGEFENSKGEPTFAILEDGASAQEVQAGIEVFYGVGNAEVEGGPDGGTCVPKGSPGAGGVCTYRVRFVGALAFQPLELLGTEFSSEFGFTSPSELVVSERKHASVGQLVVTAANLGDAATSGATTIVDTLPAGLRAVSIEGIAGESEEHKIGPVECTLATVTCTFAGNLPAYAQIEVRIGVAVEGAKSGELNEVDVHGGGAAPVSLKRPITVSSEATPFGVEDYELGLEEEGGSEDTQAGSHPFQFTTTVAMNQVSGAMPAALSKDMSFELPPGLIGNPTPFTRCTLTQFLTRVEGKDNECPESTVMGVARITVNEPTQTHLTTFTLPVFNLEPAVGEPARFGILLLFTPVVIDTSVRTGSDYGITASTSNISQAGGFLKGEVTLWGVPGDSRHDGQRGWGCLEKTRGEVALLPCEAGGQTTPRPFMALPTSCSSSLVTTVHADSWREPGADVAATGKPLAALDGCNRLPFSSSLSVAPDVPDASTPTGLSVDLHVPQVAGENPSGLVPASVKDTTVTFPAGMALDPAAAGGLEACSLAQFGLNDPGASTCPSASKVGTVEVKTPLLPDPLTGSVYTAAQNANPFGSLVAVYILVEDPVSGTRVKLAGDVHLSATGQIVTTFKDTPQLPFEDFRLHLFTGPRAAVSTPAFCGPYTTEAAISSWSGREPQQDLATFQIAAGPTGGPCPSLLPFSPTVTAGAVSSQAGAFTPVSVGIDRNSGEQQLHGVQTQMPPGLSGRLTGVTLCSEEQANAGSCSLESLIGEASVSVGLGATPFNVAGGKVYLTGPYEGAPFGLSIVTPAKAGPYDLGEGTCDCIVVRARVEVDPQTAALTVTTDTAGAYTIPSILQGIPLQIRHVEVTINRAEFAFNPTSCQPLAVGATLLSGEGASDRLSVPFHVTNCAVLSFGPKFAATTSGHTSRARGASLRVKLTFPKARFGSQANVAKVKVELPKQLPARLSTLHMACLLATFEADPAKCPAGSRVGHARVTTPVLPVPMEGDAYFISHGGAKLPDLTLVLKGYGVTVDLVGSTVIRKGVTISTFETVPDVPVNTFELTLPEGPDSALGAIGSLCGRKLTMPTIFTAQSGRTLRQATEIAVTGCGKAKARGRKARRTRRHP